MSQDDGGGVGQQGGFEDVARMHDRGVCRAAREFVVRNDMAAGGQTQQTAHLDDLVSKQRDKDLGRILRGLERFERQRPTAEAT